MWAASRSIHQGNWNEVSFEKMGYKGAVLGRTGGDCDPAPTVARSINISSDTEEDAAHSVGAGSNERKRARSGRMAGQCFPSAVAVNHRQLEGSIPLHSIGAESSLSLSIALRPSSFSTKSSSIFPFLLSLSPCRYRRRRTIRSFRMNLSVDFRLVRRLSDSIAAVSFASIVSPRLSRAQSGGDVGSCSQELHPIDRWHSHRSGAASSTSNDGIRGQIESRHRPRR
ncbi:hypothetical protein NL676_029491 [Syzygium grande]|nr:hypothetical protein NL676_029491 [Syzygium grande]